MKVRKGSISEFVLLVLEKTVDGYVRFEDFAYHHYRYRHGVPELDKSALAMALKRLREGGLIEKGVNEEKVVFRLTALGRGALNQGIFDESKWDGRWRLVIFDIPEKNKTVRNLLRRKLKGWGFRQWQKSVWLSKQNVTEALRKLIRDLGIEHWVAVFESEDQVFSNIQLNDRSM